jgi:ornithine decarboxylase
MMIKGDTIKGLIKRHGTPLFIVDHAAIRRNYAEFRRGLPRVNAYYAVKANPDPAIVRTLFDAGAGFDVASMPEFKIVNENIKRLRTRKRQQYIWDKIIYANPIKANETLRALDPYRPLVTFDNCEEIGKIRRYAPHAGLVLRLCVPNNGAMVELSSKFGAGADEAVDLIAAAHDAGLGVEGLSFHVGSQTSKSTNFLKALRLTAGVLRKAAARGFALKLVDIGGGFPAPYNSHVQSFKTLAQRIGPELDKLFPQEIEIIAEPGRFLVATAATAVAQVIGKARRSGKPCYYLDDGVYHTFSGIIFDHCEYHLKAFKRGPTQVCSVFGPTCDALDTISINEKLPQLALGDYVYACNIGAYSRASSTWFNGFPPAKVVHLNQ